MSAKATDYLDAGVIRVWVVDAKAKTVTIFYPDTRPQTKSGADSLADSLLDGLQITPEQIFQTEIREDIYGGFKQEALNRICERDEKDWSIVALALAFGCPIWTEEQDFFGTGIATWRTKNIEIFFEE